MYMGVLRTSVSNKRKQAVQVK